MMDEVLGRCANPHKKSRMSEALKNNPVNKIETFQALVNKFIYEFETVIRQEQLSVHSQYPIRQSDRSPIPGKLNGRPD